MSESRTIVVAAADSRGLEGEVSAHFGRCPAYVVCRVEDDRAESVEIVENPHARAHRPGVMPAFIRDLGADVIIAGGMGPRAIQAFEKHGIETVSGCSGGVGEVLDAYLAGELRGGVPCSGGHAHGHAHGHGQGSGSHSQGRRRR